MDFIQSKITIKGSVINDKQHESQIYQYELNPIHLYDNFRFLMGILYVFHPLTLKYDIFTNWIGLIPMG